MGTVRPRPSVAAACTVLLACLPASGRGDLSTGVHVTAADLASVLLIAVAALVLLRSRPAASLPVRALVLAPVAGMVSLAALASPDLLGGLPGYARYVQVFVLVPLAVLVTVRNRADVLIVGGALVGAAAVEGLVGCLQAFTGTGASYAGERVRAVGTFGAPDVMGMASVVSYGAIILLAVGLRLRGRRRAAALAGAALLCVPLVLSLSRGTWLALLCAVLVMLFLYRRALAARLLLAGAVATTVLAFGPGTGWDLLDHRLASIGSAVSQPDRSVNDRYSLWLTATGMWMDHPLTGAGPRGFARLRDMYAPIELSSGSDTDDPAHGFQRRPLLSPHNMYLLTLSEQGLLGLSALLLFLGALARWAVRGAALAAAGLLTWHLVAFCYGDIGGPSTVVMSVVLGLVLSLVARPAAVGPSGGIPVPAGGGVAP
ncbi:O-antigen ligase family protein [Nonomuraea jiangxiensis]|uniref:O-antigen ligase n=1 Tax=Nonomuraea jiangxiensis TaxID=633440 RepID=A0A1G9P7T6_9ACTN|nr:O-antigen ligase family protein [Nonomuraea jiangxiensis]SDL94581.1 O-antigen ligase [Nonomuraea jiangxiensis]